MFARITLERVEIAADLGYCSRWFVEECVIFKVYDVLVQNASKAEIEIPAIYTTVEAFRLAINSMLLYASVLVRSPIIIYSQLHSRRNVCCSHG